MPKEDEKESKEPKLPKKITLGSASRKLAIKDLLEQIPLIRVVVNGGRGLGHQAASVTAMNRLRELGYEGDFHVVYEKEYVRENLNILMPEATSEKMARKNRVTFELLDGRSQ